MSRYHAIATRYDSGFGTVDYTCDSCGNRQRSMGTPPGWAESGKTHRCPGCAGTAGLFRGMSVQGRRSCYGQVDPRRHRLRG